ncbi:MAG: flagellin, partial [Proteobacteria bacterium]
MASIMTNTSALTALQSLAATNKALETTQSRISTGYRVAEASDNSAYWSIATTMRSDNKANSVLQDALGLGAGKVDTAYTAMKSAIEVVDSIKEKVLLAKTAGAEDRAKIQTEIETLQAQLKDNVAGANYAGSNLLKTTGSGNLTVMTSYNRDSSGNVTTGTIDVDYTKTRLIDSGSAKTGMLDKTFTVASGNNASVLSLKVSGTGAASTSTAFD